MLGPSWLPKTWAASATSEALVGLQHEPTGYRLHTTEGGVDAREVSIWLGAGGEVLDWEVAEGRGFIDPQEVAAMRTSSWVDRKDSLPGFIAVDGVKKGRGLGRIVRKWGLRT